MTLLQKIADKLGIELDTDNHVLVEAAPIKRAQDQMLVLDVTNSTVRIQLRGYTLNEYALDVIIDNK